MSLTIDSLYRQNLELQDRLRVLEDTLQRIKPGQWTDPPPFDRSRYASRDYVTDPPPDQFQTNPIVDPAPYDFRHRYCGCPYHRHWPLWPPWPPPYADPVPMDASRRAFTQSDAREKMMWPQPIPWDPMPFEYFRIPIVDLIRKFRGSDKITIDNIADLRIVDLIPGIIPGGGVTDPGPEDWSRLSKADLEATHHRINSELIRLKSLEKRISEMVIVGNKAKGGKRK
ncbi:MAG: hypothetical protein GY841_18410 [FCB group bacterium]|nr:hypothetical protein [FCB group bacterium]